MAKPEQTQRIYVRLQFLQAPYPQGPEYVAPLRVDGESNVGRSMKLTFQGVPDSRGFVYAIASVTGVERPSSLYWKGKGFALQANDTVVLARGETLKSVMPNIMGDSTIDGLPEGDQIVDALPKGPVHYQRHAPRLEGMIQGSGAQAPTEIPVKHGWHAPYRYEGFETDPDGEPPPPWDPKLK
jgi:hypothetical protein